MNVSNKIKKFQEGGAAPDPAAQGAPAEGGQPDAGAQDPTAQLMQMAQQAVQGKDCNAAMATCQALLQMLSQAQGGGGEGGGQAPEGAPVYKKGGVLIKRI